MGPQLAVLFGSAFVVALSGAMMPGPVLFATVRWGVRHGRWVGPAIVAGHAAVEVPLMLAIIFGLGEVLARPSFVGVVGLLGGAALLGMGVLMLAATPTIELPGPPDPAAGPPAPAAWHIVAAGALTSLANPYFPLWWGTVGMNFLVHARPLGASGYVVFYVGHLLADLAWYGAVSESVHHGRRLLSDRSYRWLVGACGVLLIGFALFFAQRGWRFLAAS